MRPSETPGKEARQELFPLIGSEPTSATDPVCGMTVDPLTAMHRAMHHDQTYWFCSAGCEAEFRKAPERYLRPIEA